MAAGLTRRASTTPDTTGQGGDMATPSKTPVKRARKNAVQPSSAPTDADAPVSRVVSRLAGAAGVQQDDASAPAVRLLAVADGQDGADATGLARKMRNGVARAAVVAAPAGRPARADLRPQYWERACADLMTRDRILKKLIPQFGPVHLMTRGDPFATLARSIVGQQISVKAAQAVWDRVEAASVAMTPAHVVELGQQRLAACGLSKRKAEYILDLAQHFRCGTLHVDTWADMDDEAVIAELTQIRGIGRWTAEMFLIFNLVRPDVLPLDDVGLIRAISVNYFSGEPVTRSEAREVAANWEPWRTVATWYMWRSLDPLPVDY
jgi:DNA-3-methyladenine glycosylase II